MQRSDLIEEFVRARSGALLRFAYLLTGNQAHAEDLVQEALAIVCLKVGQLEHEEALESYVRTTMTRTHLSWVRRRSWRELLRAEPEDRVATSDAHEDLVGHLDLWPAVQKLPPRQRTIVVLRFYEDLPETGIAETMGISVGTVKSQLHAALANLRKMEGVTRHDGSAER